VPVVVLNSNDFPRGRLFTLLHEVAHLARHQFGICTPSKVPPNSALYPPEEVYCNAVAAATLMPADAVAASAAGVHVGGAGEVSDADLGKLAHKFGVSREAMLRRLVTLGISTQAFYATKREEFLRAYGETVPTPGGNHYTNQVARLGRPFCNLVLGAYSEGRLPLSEAAMVLGVRATKLQEIARRVA
jgi:Zn-dependent peptidase ImmA (M78 family)